MRPLQVFDGYYPSAIITYASHMELNLISFLLILQFWAAYVPCEAQHKDAVQITLEQIDVIKRLTERYSPGLTSCASVYGTVVA